MTHQQDRKNFPAPPMTYQIRIDGHLDDKWEDWFEDVTITLEDNGQTLLTCVVVDQSALHALLTKVRNLGMPLLSVNRIYPDPGEEADVDQKI
jgi:hypothetical protein